MKIIHAEGKPLIPWKNGGGLTREIAVHFDQARHHDFLWRISMAIIDQPCHFSRFDGIDRTIALLDGKSVSLKKGSEHIGINIGEKSFSFRGEEEVTATPIGTGRTTDLNVMTRRGFFTHKMEYYLFHDHSAIEAVADITFIICNNNITLNGQELQPFDTSTDFIKGEKITLKTQEKAQVFIIGLFAC